MRQQLRVLKDNTLNRELKEVLITCNLFHASQKKAVLDIRQEKTAWPNMPRALTFEMLPQRKGGSKYSCEMQEVPERKGWGLKSTPDKQVGWAMSHINPDADIQLSFG